MFTWVLERLGKEGLLAGKTLGIDATTLEANAAMRSIVRRDTGASYEEFLKGLDEPFGPRREDHEDVASPSRALGVAFHERFEDGLVQVYYRVKNQ